MEKPLLLSGILLMVSCTDDKINWINNYQAPCEGVGSMQCLQIQKGDTIESQNWKLFYSSIEGFENEPGFIYKLRVRKEQIPAENVPADGSSIHYTLTEVLAKQRDTTLRFMIFGLWNGLKAKRSTSGKKSPVRNTLKLNLTSAG